MCSGELICFLNPVWILFYVITLHSNTLEIITVHTLYGQIRQKNVTFNGNIKGIVTLLPNLDKNHYFAQEIITIHIK